MAFNSSFSADIVSQAFDEMMLSHFPQEVSTKIEVDDEYTRDRKILYAYQDYVYKVKMRILGLVLVALLIAAFIVK